MRGTISQIAVMSNTFQSALKARHVKAHLLILTPYCNLTPCSLIQIKMRDTISQIGFMSNTFQSSLKTRHVKSHLSSGIVLLV